MVIAVYVNAGNDRNGNPRRGWAIFGEPGTKFVNEGYNGSDYIDRVLPHAEPTYPALSITPGQYAKLKKAGK